ncbi:MAG: hypothetical protein ACK5RG_11680 [Cyclobacteriaceae bacterium]|jgi:hypothetical protein|nr:hypothetical protein [Flammeovirgaceae bacterium]
MKLRNGIYFLLLLIACKDGGVVPNAALQNDWVKQYNQQIALNYVNGSAAKLFSFNTGGKQFTVPVPLPGTCNSPDSEVSIDGIAERFEAAYCYTIDYPWSEDSYLYVITTSRREFNKLQIVTYTFPGKSPISKTYSINKFNLNAGYSVFGLNPDGSINGMNQEYYYPVSGDVDLFNSFGAINIISNLTMERRNIYKSIYLGSKLSCCSQ